MKVLNVGISDCQVSDDPQLALMTYALGSCIALMVYDPVQRVAGLLHFMLPEAGPDQQRAQAKPYMFADSGVPMLFRKAYQLGAVKQRMIVAAVGGAQVLDTSNTFCVGERNQLALRRILSKAEVRLHHEELGGTAPRNAGIQVRDGEITVSRGREEHCLTSSSQLKRGPVHHAV